MSEMLPRFVQYPCRTDARGGDAASPTNSTAGSRLNMHGAGRGGAKTDNFPTARRLLLHLDSQVAHAAFAE